MPLLEVLAMKTIFLMIDIYFRTKLSSIRPLFLPLFPWYKITILRYCYIKLFYAQIFTCWKHTHKTFFTEVEALLNIYPYWTPKSRKSDKLSRVANALENWLKCFSDSWKFIWFLRVKHQFCLFLATPWLYFRIGILYMIQQYRLSLINIIIMRNIHFYMWETHESLCNRFITLLKPNSSSDVFWRQYVI